MNIADGFHFWIGKTLGFAGGGVVLAVAFVAGLVWAAWDTWGTRR